MSAQPKALFLADVIETDPTSAAHHDEAAAELRHLHGMVKRLSATCDELEDALAAGCDEGRDQLWESGGAAGCSRALSAEFQRDALLEALKAAVVRAELRREGAVDVAVICAVIKAVEKNT